MKFAKLVKDDWREQEGNSGRPNDLAPGVPCYETPAKDMDVMKVSVNRLAPAFLLLGMSLHAAESPVTNTVLSQSRDLVARGSLDDAVALLEKSLENAPEADLPSIIDQLRKFYLAAINENRKSGRYEQADHYAHNLKVMDSAAQVSAESSDSNALTTPGQSPEPEPVPSAAPAPAIPRVRRADPQDSLAPPVAQAEKSSTISTANRLATPVASEPARSPQPNVQQFDVAEADEAFNKKQYDAAGNIYGRLYTSGKLPDSRRSHLAYCRAADLVARINQNPKSADEWTRIETDLKGILAIQPDFWFAEYLRDLVNERSGRALSANGKSGNAGTQLASNDSSTGLISRAARQIGSININPLKR